tara:strand:- start:161 stop:862 length:702 start_codon:yes stop_codon:yes gene_type:complete
MKFTNVVFSVMCIALLNSCSSLIADIETGPSVSEVSLEPLTAMQIEVADLQAMPNLYLEQAGNRKSTLSSQTLNQFQGALALKQQGKLSQAKKQLVTLAEEHPELSGIWLQLALVSKQQNKDDIEQKREDMLEYLYKAVAANPLNYLAQNELALVLRQQGQFQQSLSHYELALKSWPAFAPAYLNRGILYDLYMGKKSLALAEYELYQALSNDDSRQLKGWIIDLQRQIKNAE